MSRKVLVCLGLVLTAMLLLLSCTPLDESQAAQYTISGKVIDMLNGEPIVGAKILAGSYTATTDASGNYSISVDKSAPTVSGVFAAFKGLGYFFFAIDQVSIDATTNPVFNLALSPSSNAGYPSIDISGRIYYQDGTTELEDNSEVVLCILDGSGGMDLVSDSSYSQAGGGYSVTPRSFGSSCFVAVMVMPDAGAPFSFYLKNQDLSGDKSGYSLTQSVSKNPIARAGGRFTTGGRSGRRVG